MQHNLDLDKLAIELKISTDRLGKNIATYAAMSELFPALEVAGCEVGLFGGTALNKIYFGKRQRLSYDLDIFVYNYDKTMEALKKNGAKVKYSGVAPMNKKAVSMKMEYRDIILDIVNAKDEIKPMKLQAFDLLYYYDRLLPPVVVPSYPLEYLLAEKTMALLDRNELRDIYDTWTGISLLKNIEGYAKYIKKAAKARGAGDIVTYADFQIMNMLQNVSYYEKKEIEVSSIHPNTPTMLKGIKAFLDTNI